MPAAAVTPAPIAYIKVVAVKELVVGYLALIPDPPLFLVVLCRLLSWPSFRRVVLVLYGTGTRSGSFTLKKLECSKQALLHLNILAWNNKIGLRALFCWFLGPK